MTFFALQEPNTGSDYKHTQVNGEARTTYGMPGVECSVCGRVGPLGHGTLPYRLPPALTADRHLQDRWPVPEVEWHALKDKVEAALRESQPGFEALGRFTGFPPITWKVPSRPTGDFFWAHCDGPIVSRRIADALRSLDATGFALIPVDEVRSGRRSASEDLPIPESGEPEDLLDWATEAREGGGGFFLRSVLTKGNLTSRMERHPACTGCGYAETTRRKGWEAWEDAIWPGEDIFHFPTTSWH